MATRSLTGNFSHSSRSWTCSPGSAGGRPSNWPPGTPIGPSSRSSKRSWRPSRTCRPASRRTCCFNSFATTSPRGCPSSACSAWSPGTSTKLVLAFRRTRKGTVFWPPTVPLLATSLATQLWWPTGWGFDDRRTFLASCLVGGAAVERFAERDPREVGLVQLAHMFGRDRVFPKALQWHQVKAWHADPRIKGGYSSVPAGADPDLLTHLEAVEDEATPQLVFAG